MPNAFNVRYDEPNLECIAKLPYYPIGYQTASFGEKKGSGGGVCGTGVRTHTHTETHTQLKLLVAVSRVPLAFLFFFSAM